MVGMKSKYVIKLHTVELHMPGADPEQNTLP